MNLRKKEEAIRNLIEEELEFDEGKYHRVPDWGGKLVPSQRITLRREDLAKLDITPREVSTILSKFESDQTIYSFEIRPSVKVMTMLDLFRKQKLSKRSLSFDERTGKLSYGSKIIEIPVGTNAYYVCKVVFDPKNQDKQIPALEVQDMIDHAKSSSDPRAVEQAARSLNQRARKGLGIRQLVKFSNYWLWLNP